METTRLLRSSLLMIITAMLMACGGGGDGGPAAVYSGKTNQALIDGDNAKLFSDTASVGSGTGGGLIGTFNVTQSGSNGSSNLHSFVKSFRKFANNFDVKQATPLMPTAITDSNSFPGECGGSFSYTIDYNETTGNFNGSLSFNSYNDCIGTMNGAITFYGSDTSATLSMSFLALSYTGASDSVTMSGNISFTTLPSSITESITMSMDFRDNNTGETYRIKDMTMEVTTSALTESTIVKSGQVYHPDYGYVDVSTTSPILVNKDALNPHAGVLVMAGDGSTATVTFVNSNQYTIEVDVDNVAPPEVTKNCTWVPDVCN